MLLLPKILGTTSYLRTTVVKCVGKTKEAKRERERERERERKREFVDSRSLLRRPVDHLLKYVRKKKEAESMI
jgi:hypothetical protein